MNPLIYTLLISMVPVIELRGAIPVALANGVSPIPAICVAMIGNLLPVPFIILFIRRILKWLKSRKGRMQRLANWVEAHAAKRIPKVQKYAFWGLVLFVAIPLPGTGAWSGALVAAMLDMRLKKAFPAIMLGVLIAGMIVGLASSGTIMALSGGAA